MTMGKTGQRSIILRGTILSVIWWILTDGATVSCWIGIPAVVLASAASMTLLPPNNIILHEFLRFIPFFLNRSLLGGVDVASRALKPAMPISPDLIEYSSRLPKGLPQVFLANTISLLPGTLSAAIDQNILRIHVLDIQNDVLSELEDVERRVARVFAVNLDLFGKDKYYETNQ